MTWTLGLVAERDREGLIHVADLKLANGTGGTSAALSGNVELGTARRRLSVTTTLGQDLAKLATIPTRFTGQGALGLEATVTSPDLTLFRVRATLKGENVSLKMPRAGVEVEAANGQVPITVALEVGKDGVALRADEKRSHYSMLRFADQHPLLSRSGFLSITSLKTPFVTIAPLVGNLEIEQNVISLRQFEISVRGEHYGAVRTRLGRAEVHPRAPRPREREYNPPTASRSTETSRSSSRPETALVEGRAEILRIEASGISSTSSICRTRSTSIQR